MPHASDGAALLRAICDNPEEDTPRLMYADWLDEQAEVLPSHFERAANMAARAEFIRIQIAEAAKGVDRDGYRPRTAREGELLMKWNTPDWWQAELPEHPGVSMQGQKYERGFPFHLYAGSVRSFLKAAPDVYSRVPATQVRFQTITPKTAGELGRSPFLSRIRYLDQLNGITDDALRGLANSLHLGNITKLVFGEREITSQGLAPFLASPSLTRLKFFMTLYCPLVGPGIVPALATCPSAPMLEDVCLRENGLASGPLPDFATLFRLPKLRDLNLSMNRMADAGAEAAAGVGVDTDARIDLGWNQITDRGGEALLKGPLLRSPRVRVDLNGNLLSDGMKAKLKDAFGDRVKV